MGLLDGKKGLVFGIANDRSIAAAIAKELHEQGAEMGFTHLPDADPARPKAEKRLRKVVEDWNPRLVMPCDVQNEASLDAVFDAARENFGTIDFLLHSIAYAPIEDLQKPVYAVSRAGFSMSMEVSAFSLIDLVNRAKPLMPNGGSVLTMTYLGGETVIPRLQPDGPLQSGSRIVSHLPRTRTGAIEHSRQRHQRRTAPNTWLPVPSATFRR